MVQANAAEAAATGLDFRGSASTTGTPSFQFTDPLSIYPATYVWNVYPRQQNGYYTTFFWGNRGSFYWDKGAPNSYYGAHPYPNSPPNGSAHRWALAVDAGNYVNDNGGNDTAVVHGRWYTQALRVWADGSGNKHHEFYWDLPDTSRVIRVVIPSRYGNTTPTTPVLSWGDAPWNPSNEILNGVLRGIQIYSATLSVEDVLAELSSPMSTAQGASSIWYLNRNPTPGDISDKSGRGHHPSWAGSDRPLLWSAAQEGGGVPAPLVTISADPASVTHGGTSTLVWSSQGASNCEASGAWSGNRPTAGSAGIGPLTAPATFTLTCTGQGGATSRSASVDVVAQAPAPTLSLSATPSQVASGGTATLSWSSTNATSCTASGAWSGSRATSGSEMTPPLASSGTFTLNCAGAGGSASQSATVTVASAAPSLSFSANPVSVSSGGSSTLSWSSQNASRCTASGAWSGRRSTSGSSSTGPLNTSRTYTLSCTGPGGTTTRSVTVTVVAATPAPTVSISANPAAVAYGGSSTLSWSSQNASSCSASGAWSGSRATSGSAGTGSLTASSTFTLACTGAGGTTVRSATVTVSPPAPAPTINFSANPSEVSSGGTSTLSWSSTNADSCTASGGWSGNRGTSGSATTVALTSTSTFTLSCSGEGGSATSSVTVTVVQPTPAPSVSFNANPTSVPSGSASTLSWSTQNASSCTASGAWSGSRATSGSASTGALTSTSTYTLACSGPGGTTSRSATVGVIPQVPAPTITLSANPTQVNSGGSSTLSWSSTNADSCTASGGWSGARAPSGSEATQPLDSTQTYNLSCTGPGGSTSRSATVTVNSPGGGTSGLDFPGSAATSGTIRFQFTNPLAIYPATYIWKVYPRQQSGYYTTFFWGNNGHFWWDSGAPNTYYGAHPYPNTQPNGNTHRWEVAVDAGDYVTDANGNNTSVQYGRWFTQALRVWADGSGNKHHEFYWDLPDTSRVIRVVIPSRYGNKTPPSPVLVWGDAPWNPSNEILNGVLRGIQVYSATLSVPDILSEVSNPQGTSAGASSIWYLNLNPTPTDISDKSGRGHHPSWVGSERPMLWTGP